MSAPLRTDLRDRLPLPLARLHRRAHNAKSHLERHHGAFYLLEAVVKLATSAQVAGYRALGERDTGIDRRLAALALPALEDRTFLLRDLAALARALDHARVRDTDLAPLRSEPGFERLFAAG